MNPNRRYCVLLYYVVSSLFGCEKMDDIEEEINFDTHKTPISYIVSKLNPICRPPSTFCKNISPYTHQLGSYLNPNWDPRRDEINFARTFYLGTSYIHTNLAYLLCTALRKSTSIFQLCHRKQRVKSCGACLGLLVPMSCVTTTMASRGRFDLLGNPTKIFFTLALMLTTAVRPFSAK